MAETVETLQRWIATDEGLAGHEFRYLQEVDALLAQPDQRTVGHDLLLRALDTRESFA